MFERQVKELYKYLTNKNLDSPFSIIPLERRSIVEYSISNYTWLLLPKESLLTKENYKTNTTINETTYIFFIDNPNFGKMNQNLFCRKLTIEDKLLFNQFKNSCSKEDQEEGMVSLDDDLVYGLFIGDKIVAASSLWNWGPIISDIGILVDPKYRNMGCARTLCLNLIKDVDRLFVWRCSKENKGSYQLAISMGFVESGQIKELVMKK